MKSYIHVYRYYLYTTHHHIISYTMINNVKIKKKNNKTKKKHLRPTRLNESNVQNFVHLAVVGGDVKYAFGRILYAGDIDWN